MTDNVIVAQEKIHSIQRMKGKKGGMTIKVDLEKAYDRISWPFLKMVLEDMGFPVKWVSLIMSYVTTSSLSILWNLEKLPAFHPERGIR